jgi:hypothetical protein
MDFIILIGILVLSLGVALVGARCFLWSVLYIATRPMRLAAAGSVPAAAQPQAT